MGQKGVQASMAKKKEKKPTKRQQKVIGAMVRKMMHEWERTGEIKTSRATYKPKSKKEAIAQALAIEYGKQGVGRAGKRKRGEQK